jgi:hypothetical protein
MKLKRSRPMQLEWKADQAHAAIWLEQGMHGSW